MAGVAAALWLLGLFAAAPALRTDARYDFADRLRDALFIGVAIPFGLGLVHLLYPVACWIVLAACIATAVYRVYAQGGAHQPLRMQPYVLIAALVAVAWPQLMRPLLDGDSLSYHLPNAAAWVQAHSLWTTATSYWWYPPSSELFASALYAVSGPFALPWGGFGALALLGFRIHSWARAYRAPARLADALAAATVTAYPLAIEAGTLQNDVWLAAFWLECLWLLQKRNSDGPAMRALAVTALLKPQGWLLAAVALIASGAQVKLALAPAGAVAIWILRDASMWQSAAIAPASTVYGDPFGSTILAHGAPAFALLVRVALAASPFALLCLLGAFGGPLIARSRRAVGWAACAAAAIFFVLPFGYATSVAQLATGASLRFASPAIAAGAVILGRPMRRFAAIATALLLASTLFGLWQMLAVFWNDAPTRVAIVFAGYAVAIAATTHLARVVWPNAVGFGVAVLAATYLAARHPLNYYDDALRVGGMPPGVYRWIETQRPAGVGGWGVRLGVVNVLSPSTGTIDVADEAPCEQARRERVLLVAVAQNDRPADANARRLAQARACGRTLYDDPIGVVAQP
ncbi:MAG TPA: hypothetical protein VFF63_07975 [Candidatus Babeliales bacterium]|nr:hypothetical protein [Candidatus Babeliales bacterium]